MSGLSAFLPRSLHGLVGAALRGGDAFQRVTGTVLFCDVAGFTPLTEALSVLGKEGAEELTRLLNGYFTRMIGIIEGEGGDILRFGGDSMAVLFPGPQAGPALRAAADMMGAMGEFATLPTRAGNFKLSMKIGAAFGEVLLGIVGDGSGSYEFYGAGLPLDDSAEAEHHAKAGLVICHGTAAETCGPEVPLEPHGEGFFRLSGIVGGTPRAARGAPPAAEGDLSRMVPAYLLNFAGEGVIGEHRGTAVLFASISGIASPGPRREGHSSDADTHRSIELIYRAFSGAARRFGGVVNKLDMGDKGFKFLLLFGSPHALENKEEMAARAALDLLGNTMWPERVALRMGLTASPLFTGPVGSPRRREFTVMGDGINLAARLMQAASWGQVLCDRHVASAACAHLRFREFPPISVKGKKEPVVPSEPLGEREEEAGPSGALVEREPLCKALWEHLSGGSGPHIALIGEAGAGKTALMEWARWEVRRKGGQASLVTLGPYSLERPFSAWRPHLRYILGLTKGDPAEAVRASLAVAMAAEPPEYRLLLNPLLDIPEEESEAIRNLSPKERKDLTFAMLGRVLARSGPRALLMDNLHCADPLSLEFLQFLLEDPEPPPWRLVTAIRPGMSASETALANMRSEELAPLSPQGLAAVLRKRHGLIEIEKDVLEWFVTRSRGNPAIISALVVALEGAGLIVRDAYGARVDADRLFRTTFPDTLEGLYLARVDILPARSRQVLQQASVLGTAVSGNLLSRLTGLEGEGLAETLLPLTEGGILLQDSWGQRPYFRFGDALMRDAVYEAMPFSLKREAHLRVAEFLEPDASGNARLWPTLANHFEWAGEDPRALRYHRLAGRDAATRSDNLTALKHLEFVCREIGPDADDIEDAFRLLDVYASLGRRDEARATLARLQQVREGMTPSHLGRFQYFLAREAFQERKWEDVEALLMGGLRFYQEAGDIAGVGKSYVNLVGLVYGPTGRLDEAKACLERSLALPQGPDQTVFRTMAAMNLGLVNKYQGDIKGAARWLRSAHRLAALGSLGPQQGNIADNLGALYCDLGKFERAVTWGRRSVKSLDTFAMRGIAQNAKYNLAVALLSTGRSEKVTELLVRVARQAQQTSNLQVQASAAQALSQAAFQNGDLESCLTYASAALRQFFELKNGRDFRFTLLGPALLFYALQSLEKARAYWAAEEVQARLAETQPNAVADASLHRVHSWMEGHVPQGDAIAGYLREGEETSPEEHLERMLWLAEAELRAGNHEAVSDLTRLARKALGAWPHFDAKVRYLGLNASVGTLSREDDREARVLIRRSRGGVWGLRLLCLLTLRDEAKKARELSLRTARNRLTFIREHSPAWAWAKLSAFPEVAQVLQICATEPVSRRRRSIESTPKRPRG